MWQVPSSSSSFFLSVFFLLAAFFLALFGSFHFLFFLFLWLGVVELASILLPLQLLFWIKAMTWEVICILGTILLVLIPISRKSKGKKKPILLVHGYLNHKASWLIFRKRLQHLGLGPIYVMNLGSPFYSIEEYANKLKKEIVRIKQKENCQEVILIAHSMGGIVCSYYAAFLTLKEEEVQIITIATPFQGTPTAYLGIGQSAKDLRPNSSLLQKISDKLKEETRIRFCHIASQTDEIVLNPESCILKGNPWMMFEDIGHLELVYSKRCAQQVALFL